MRKEIKIEIAPEPDLKKEISQLSLHYEGQPEDILIDLDGTALLKASRIVPDLAQDFLCIAACVYAADKSLRRNDADDRWTRNIGIEIPVENEDAWSAVSTDLSNCISFLTGDKWDISFRKGEKRLIQKRPRQRRVPCRRPSAKAVCLFSGGLDSFIGAVDWLTENPHDPIFLVGHYDGDVGGPKKDQETLRNLCRQRFGNRFQLAQGRVGLASGSADTNFRSRSLLFIALGCYFAEVIGGDVPVLIPENGPIALNFPLTPSRRGSCSTRTVHPHFIGELNALLAKVGIRNEIKNPYEFKTKGEMVAECQDLVFLKSASSLTRSCAKGGHRKNWTFRTARSCGVCVPCLFRRAALHRSGIDDECYGKQVEDIHSFADTPTDVLALLAFLRSNPSDREIASGLLANGSLPITNMADYVALVKRMRSEVLVWLQAEGSVYVKNEVRSC